MKKIFSILTIALFVSGLQAQSLPADFDKMSATRKIMYGDALMSAGSYYGAQDAYLKAYDDDASQEVAYKLGRAYYLARNYKDAEIWMKKAMEAAPKRGDAYPEAGYYYAMSLKANGKYTEAKEAFKSVSRNSQLKGASGTLMKRMSKNEDKGCDLALELAKKPENVSVEHLGNNVNNNYTDFSPRFNPDNNLTYAALISENPIDLGQQGKTELRARIFVSDAQGDNWGKSSELKAPFNKGDAHTGNGAYSPDGKRFYYTECKPNDSLVMECRIYVSEFQSGEWQSSKQVPDINASSGTTTQPCIGTYKGKEIMYFVSDRVGGRGGMDIWYCEIQGKGKSYSNPINCGTKINTPGDEITPFYNDELGALFFSSNGLINVGGLDVYKAEGGMKSFSAPENLGFPINSSVDDFGYSTDAAGKKGFFVSNRKGGFSVKSETCCDDIYYYKFPPEFTIMARAIDEVTKEVLTDVSIDLSQNGVRTDSAVSKAGVDYEDFFVGTAQMKFELTSYKDKYKNGHATTSTTGMTESDTLYVDILMEPIIPEVPIEVKNIYYELGKWDLRPESFKALDSLYSVLQMSPQLKVEIGSHTDSRDTEERNNILSQHRADTVVNYFLSKGMDPDRLVAKGYGESTPRVLKEDLTLPSGKVVPTGTVLTEAFINKYKGDDYETLHQLNRRTEFKIIGIIPHAVIKYDEATIEANEARKREEEEKRKKQLQDMQTIDESGGDDTSDNTNNTNNNTNTNNNNKNTNTNTNTNTGGGVDPTMTKKANMFEGHAMINNKKETTYLLNLSPSLTYAMVSRDMFIELRNAGVIKESDIKNDKPTDLGNGTTVKGDVFSIATLQLGDITLNNVDTKINLASTQPFIVGVKVVEKGGCSFDQAKARFKCKK